MKVTVERQSIHGIAVLAIPGHVETPMGCHGFLEHLTVGTDVPDSEMHPDPYHRPGYLNIMLDEADRTLNAKRAFIAFLGEPLASEALKAFRQRFVGVYIIDVDDQTVVDIIDRLQADIDASA